MVVSGNDVVSLPIMTRMMFVVHKLHVCIQDEQIYGVIIHVIGIISVLYEFKWSWGGSAPDVYLTYRSTVADYLSGHLWKAIQVMSVDA